MPSKRLPPPSLEGRPTTARSDVRWAGVLEVDITQITTDPHQPRRDWHSPEAHAALEELAASIRSFGLLQPLVVRPTSEAEQADGPGTGTPRYVVIAGERRLKAAALAALSRVPVVVSNAEGTRIRLLQLTENIQRRALHPLEEARAMQEIIDAEGIDAEDLGRRLQVSGQTVRNRVALLADQVIHDAITQGRITPTAGNLIMRLPPEEKEHYRDRLRAGDRLVTTSVIEARRKRIDRERHAAASPPAASPPTLLSPAGRTAQDILDEVDAAEAAQADAYAVAERPRGPAAPPVIPTPSLPVPPVPIVAPPVSTPETAAPPPQPQEQQAPAPVQAVGREERAAVLGGILQDALFRGLQTSSERRDALAGMKEIAGSPRAAEWALDLLRDLIARMERARM